MEELKEVAEIIKSLGESGISAFVWWVVLSKGADLLSTFAVTVGFLLGIRAVGTAVAAAMKASGADRV